MDDPSNNLFRQEALRHASGAGDGDVLRLSPGWTRWTFWLLALAFVAALAFCALATLHTYAAGPALVWVAPRTQVASPVAGTVTSVEVRPGQRVEPGRLLVRLSSSSRLKQSSISAPDAGTIGDVRVRAGQRLEVGDVAFTIIGSNETYSIVALMPARYRPELEPGMPLRVEVEGYRYAYREITITSIGSQVVGPAEARRYLGPDIADTVDIDGPVVVIEAVLPSRGFSIDGRSLNLHHGMHCTAEVRLRGMNILSSLFFGA